MLGLFKRANMDGWDEILGRSATRISHSWKKPPEGTIKVNK